MGCSASTAATSPYVKNRPILRTVYVQTDAKYVAKVRLREEEDAIDFVQHDSDKDVDESAPLIAHEHVIVPSSAMRLTKQYGRFLKHDPNNIEATWLAVFDTLDVPKGKKNPNTNLVVRRTGWKTIRIFVSSTFKDFQHEREVLVKEVFPDLRAWCEKRRLHLVECDLRWGVPKDTTTELTLRTCLGEIDRCYEDNVMPYFLNMSSERIGWIPVPGEVPQSLVEEYRWIFGLSVTEMEIIHGAYRKDNPNSLFLMRSDQFLETVPQNLRRIFVDKNPVAPNKLKMLRSMIEDRFEKERIVKYGCKFIGEDAATQKVVLDLDRTFRTSVFEFFKNKIEKQYPLEEGTIDPYHHMFESHEAFMKQRCDLVLGRVDIFNKITAYINGECNDVPLLVVGGAGSGKSSLIAKTADVTCNRALENKIPGCKQGQYHVFYHFVGAVPGSTDLEYALKRLLRELTVISDSTMPKDLEETAPMCCSALSNPNTRPAIILIDAINQVTYINQFQEEKQVMDMSWLPRKLAPQIRVVLSMITDTAQHKTLMDRDPENIPQVIHVTPLDLNSRKDIVRDVLGRYNKRLDMDQMFLLLSKESSSNPLWLSITCEELRVFGKFELVTDKIINLKDGLLDLIMDVLGRFEEENGGHLLIATLCLLEASNTGLLENELLSLLAAEEKLIPPQDAREKGAKETKEKKKNKSTKEVKRDKLPAYKWAVVYRALRTFLRPYGDSGEGRLDFYHRSLSKAVRRKYFKVTLSDAHGEESEETRRLYTWWHTILANFFEKTENIERKVEEYPFHLIYLKDTSRLVSFLCDDKVIDELYHDVFSSQLIALWRQGGGGREKMTEVYLTICRNLMNTDGMDADALCLKLEKMAKILFQGGAYDEAREVILKAVEIEETKLGNREHRMAELCTIVSMVMDGKLKMNDFMYRSMLPQERECIKWTQRAIDLRKPLAGKHHRMKLAKTMVQLGFTLSGFAMIGGDDQMSPSEAQKRGRELVDDAVVIYKEYDDRGNIAEAIMTKAILCTRATPEQIKLYDESMELCKQVYGDRSILAGRLFINTGIYYEETGNYNKAYEYFHNNYLVACEVFGADHPRTDRAKAILVEPRYKRIANQRGHPIPT